MTFRSRLGAYSEFKSEGQEHIWNSKPRPSKLFALCSCSSFLSLTLIFEIRPITLYNPMNWAKFKKEYFRGFYSYWTFCANWLVGLRSPALNVLRWNPPITSWMPVRGPEMITLSAYAVIISWMFGKVLLWVNLANQLGLQIGWRTNLKENSRRARDLVEHQTC